MSINLVNIIFELQKIKKIYFFLNLDFIVFTSFHEHHRRIYNTVVVVVVVLIFI